MQKMLNLLHPAAYPSGRKNDGRTALIQTHNGKWEEKLYRQKAFLKACGQIEPETPDSYFSINSFGQRRRTECLVSLNAFYVDLDPYALFKDVEFVKSEILSLAGIRYPTPSMLFDSGMGCWALWNLQPLPKEALEKWARITNYLIETLLHLGADKKVRDVTRIMRTPNTTNSKNSKLTYCTIIDPNPMRIDAFDPYLPELTPRPKPVPRQRTTTHPKLYSPYSLQRAILDDLETLAEMRDRILTGHREYFLFIWRNCLAQLKYDRDVSAQILKNKALKYLGTEPLSDREWLRSTMSPYRAEFEYYDGTYITGYKLTHEWIINALNITPAEQEKMKTLIGKEEKYRRNNNRRYDQSREEYLAAAENRKISIRKYKAENPKATAQQIADRFNVSRRTVFNAFKK